MRKLCVKQFRTICENLTATSTPFNIAATFAVPTVTGISPNSGPKAGGTPVTITGTGFLSGATVSFGAAPATGVTVMSANSITAMSPAGTGTVDVTVTTPGTSATSAADKFTYVAPAATHFSVSAPSTATAGAAIGVVVTALDASNNTVPSYSGTVAFSSTDSTAALPASVMLSNGTRSVNVNVRAEFEYQDWLSAPGPGLNITPSMFTVGLAYHLPAGKPR